MNINNGHFVHTIHDALVGKDFSSFKEEIKTFLI